MVKNEGLAHCIIKKHCACFENQLNQLKSHV